MKIEKTAIKNERPAVMTTPALRRPDDRDLVPPTPDTREAAPAEDE